MRIETPARRDDPPPMVRASKNFVPNNGNTDAKTERKRALPARMDAA